MPRAAAFFDLDRTLIAGSSAFQFARAAYKAGLMSRRQLVARRLANVAFRLQGSTERATDALRDACRRRARGVQVRDMQRLSARASSAGVLPRVYPQMLEVAYSHQDAGRPVYIVTAASQEMAELMAHVLASTAPSARGREVVDGVYTGRAGGPFTYREGKAQAMRELAEREGIDLAASWAYSRLGVRPADAARGRPSGRGQPGRGARARRARGGLGDHALRAPRRGCGWRTRRARRRPAPARRAGAPAVAARRRGARR